MIQKIIREDAPALGACLGIFSYCTWANIVTLMQQIGAVAAAITAIWILLHRIYVTIKK